MKNFKLLLATTAILSTGALLANAGTSGIEEHADLKITAKIKIITLLTIVLITIIL